MEIDDRISQLENDIRALKDNLLNYICQKPEQHPNPQWVDSRLEALEGIVKVLKERINE